MENCGGCSRPLRPGGQFCPGCGREVPLARPATAVGGSRTPWAVLTAVAAAACVVAVLVLGPWRSAPALPLNPAGPAPTSTAPAPTYADAPTTSTSAQDRLATQVGTNRAAVEQLVDYWVPQVSSKALGTVVAGQQFTNADIFDNYQAWASRFPDALLLRSDDYSSFSASGYWVTVVARSFTTAEQANAWCDAQLLPADDCFAKRISHTSGPMGNTVHR